MSRKSHSQFPKKHHKFQHRVKGRTNNEINEAKVKIHLITKYLSGTRDRKVERKLKEFLESAKLMKKTAHCNRSLLSSEMGSDKLSRTKEVDSQVQLSYDMIRTYSLR